MDLGKRFAIQAPDSPGCFISDTIGTANTFRCGPWRCTGIFGRAGRCGPTKSGSRYSPPAVIEPIVEQPSGVIRWRRTPSLRIFGKPHRHFCRDSLGASGRSARSCGGSCDDHCRSPLSHWAAGGSYVLAYPNRRRSRCGRYCGREGAERTGDVAGHVHGFCLRACSGSSGRSHRRYGSILCAW